MIDKLTYCHLKNDWFQESYINPLCVNCKECEERIKLEKEVFELLKKNKVCCGCKKKISSLSGYIEITNKKTKHKDYYHLKCVFK